MQITDSIADMLTRIRNASSAKHDSVKIPASNMKKAIAQILVDEGYIKGFTVEDDGKQGICHDSHHRTYCPEYVRCFRNNGSYTGVPGTAA